MSSQTNDALWMYTKDQLNDLRIKELLISQLPPTRNRGDALNILNDIYPSYVKVVKDLGICFDQMIQVQRRPYLRRFFDAANARLSELRNNIVKLELSEFLYFDHHLMQYKLIPQDIDILTPAHFSREAREQFLQDLFNKLCDGERIYYSDEDEEEEVEEVVAVAPPPKKKIIIMDEDEEEIVVPVLPHEDPNIPEEKRVKLKALYDYNNKIKLIQIAELARVARGLLIEQKKKMFIKRTGKRYPKPPPVNVLNEYATKVQAFWRGHRIRKILKAEEEERKLMIGMTKPSWRSNEVFDKELNIEERRRILRQKQELIGFGEKEKVRILAMRGPHIFEDISDEVIQWLTEWFRETGQWDRFPEIEEGGTILVVKGETLSILEWKEQAAKKEALIARYAANPELKAKDALEAKQAALAAKLKKKADKLGEKALAAELAKDPNPPWTLELGLPIAEMWETEKAYHNLYEFLKITDNPTELPYYDFVTEDEVVKIGFQIRAQVDEIMRLELVMLRAALNRDRASLRLPPLGVPKPPKKKKQKKVKDPTADRTTEDLFQELYDKQIIHSYPKTSLKEFKGDYAYCAYEQRLEFKDPPPCLMDAKHVIMTTIILPLGSKMAVRSKGVLIAGPRLCGKDLLVNAICTEAGAVMFDITPRVTVNKYPGKKGKKMLIHLLLKMARILQPSILYMDGAEKPFMGKVPPEEAANDPKLLKSELFKAIIKAIKPEDQIMLIGTSRSPWSGSQRPMMKCYQRVILLPRLEYSSLYMIWYEILMKYHGVDRNFDCSSLTKLTVGYPLPYLRKCVDQVLTPARIVRLAIAPLKVSELLFVIITGGVEPVTDKEYEKFSTWYLKTPLGQAKFKRLEDIKLELLKQAKLKEGIQKSGKK